MIWVASYASAWVGYRYITFTLPLGLTHIPERESPPFIIPTAPLFPNQPMLAEAFFRTIFARLGILQLTSMVSVHPLEREKLTSVRSPPRESCI